MRSIIGALLVAAGLAAGLPARAQEVIVEEAAASPGVEGAFVDTLDVQAVNVEVVVTDRKGDRVSGLTAADFRLLIDGQPVALDSFAEIRDGRPVIAPGAGETALPPALGDLGAGEAVGTSYLVFIDEFFSPIAYRNEALRVLARDLHLLGPRDRMAVVAFDARRLHVLADWMAPGPVLVESLHAAGKRRGYLTAADLAVASDLEPFRLSAGGSLGVSDIMEAANNQQALLESLLAREMVLAAAASLRAFDPPAGRKVALILSGGWKLTPDADASDLPTIQRELSDRGGFPILRPLTDAANLLGYTVYPIHLADMPLPSAMDRDQGNATIFNIGVDSMAYVMRQGGLLFSAEETGGRFLKAGAPHLKRIAEDTRSYYWLGFTSTAADDKRRKLEVQLVKKDLKVRARSSFLPLSRGVRTAMTVEGALLTGRDIPHARPLEVLMGEAKKAGPLTAQLPLTFRIPAEAITFLPQEGRLIADLQLWMASVDKQGRRSDVTVTPISFAVEEAPGQGKRVVYQSDILVRKAEQEVQLVLVDAQSGETLSARLRLDLDR